MVQDRNASVTFIATDGRRLGPSPPMRSRGQNDPDRDIDARSLPCWDGTPFNLAYTIDVLRGHEPFVSVRASEGPGSRLRARVLGRREIV